MLGVQIPPIGVNNIVLNEFHARIISFQFLCKFSFFGRCSAHYGVFPLEIVVSRSGQTHIDLK